MEKKDDKILESEEESLDLVFDLDDILKEFADEPGDTPPPEESGEAPEAPAKAAEEQKPAVTGDTVRLDKIADAVAAAEGEDRDDASEEEEDSESAEAPEEEPEEIAEAQDSPPPLGEYPEPFSENWEPEYDQPMGEYIPPKPAPIPFDPRQRLRELKRKLIAGPEKRYYDLCEIGVGKLQAAIFVNILILLLCGAAAGAYAADLIPENRMRLLIFSQILAMLVSALLGCYALMDGAADLLKAKFSLNTMMLFTFIACCVDAVFCLQELRVPCCAAFSLEITLSLWNRYHKRTTEMGQMDTLRKASRLDSLVKVPDYFNGKPGLLRGEGRVEDFMDNYTATPGPEKVQCVFTFISFLGCIAISTLAYLRHGTSLCIQIFATSLLVATPAGFFISLSRPMAILERRLHMTGTVICGWKSVKKLCGKAAFPLQDTDLFPNGSTKLNGVKFYGDRKPDDVIAYAASLISVNSGTLAPVFEQLRKTRGCREYRVENFRDYGGGGVGGEVNGEPVLMGTLNFLQDMGVEIPDGTMVNQAVYCSIDGQLSAVFAITYAKMRSSAAGLVSLCGYRKMTPVMICDDFMLTDRFLKSKFSVRTRRVAFPDRETRQELAKRCPLDEDPALALITKDTLNAAVYAVTGSRALRTTCTMGLILHILAGILGMLIMAALAYIGDAELLTPVSILLYQLVWLVPGLLITEWTRSV